MSQTVDVTGLPPESVRMVEKKAQAEAAAKAAAEAASATAKPAE